MNPKGKYRVIYADPPWRVGGSPPWGGKNRTTWDLPYPAMSLEEICALPVEPLGAEQSVLFLWTINRYLEQSYGVARAWGYRPNTMLTWCKKPIGGGMGGCFGFTTEFLLFATRGRIGRMGLEVAKERWPTTWVEAKRGPHSRKPGIFREMIDRMFDGPKIELFAREGFLGWDAWGNEILSNVELPA